MAHRESIRSWLKDVNLNGLDVVDWGCGTKPIKNYVFGAKSYFGIDKLDHVDADMVFDIDKELVLNKYDVAFCLEVMEHVKSPKTLLSNIFHNLKSGGRLYLSVPFLYPVHSDEDYWRFTDQGLRFLLEGIGFHILSIKPTESEAGWMVEALRPA